MEKARQGGMKKSKTQADAKKYHRRDGPYTIGVMGHIP
jgi:hypothetical protein